MHAFPISLSPRPYRGKDAKRLAKHLADLDAANRIAQFVNQWCRECAGPYVIATSLQIQHATGLDLRVITEILSYNAGGHNGITVEIKRAAD